MHIKPGDDWDTCIHAGLKACDVVVGLLTPESVHSRNVLDEWGYANSSGKTLLLLWLRETPESEVPPRYIRIQRIKFHAREEAGFAELERALGELLDRARPGPPAPSVPPRPAAAVPAPVLAAHAVPLPLDTHANHPGPLALLAIVVASVLAGHAATWVLSPLDRVAYDLLLQRHPPARFADPVTCMLVRNWPCRRSQLARGIRRIHAAGARAIGLDVGLDRIVPGDPYRDEAESRELAGALRDCAGAVVALERGEDGAFLYPHRLFGDGLEVGNAHFVLDPDGVIRRVRLRSMDGDRRVWAFGFRVVQKFWSVSDRHLPPEPLADRLTIDGHALRLVNGALMIRFRPDPRSAAPTGSSSSSSKALVGALWLEQWLEGGASIDGALFKDKLVLIGAATGVSGDSFRTPVWTDSARTPGVLVHAAVARSLIRGDAPLAVHGADCMPYLILLALLLVAACLGLPWLFACVLSIVALAGYITWALPAAFRIDAIVLPVGAPLGTAMTALLGMAALGIAKRGQGREALPRATGGRQKDEE